MTAVNLREVTADTVRRICDLRVAPVHGRVPARLPSTGTETGDAA